MANTRVDIIDDFSGGVQTTSSRFKTRTNEIFLAVNTDLRRTGGVGSRKGYTVKGGTVSTSTSTSTSTTTTSTSTTTTSTSTTT